MRRVVMCGLIGATAAHATAGPTVIRVVAPAEFVRPDGILRLGGVAGIIRRPDFHGFGDLTYQMRILGTEPGDLLRSFTSSTEGVSANETGRVNPFALPSMADGSVPGPLAVFTEDGGSVLRIAGTNATTMTGNLAAGIRSGQATRPELGAAFEDGPDVTLFQVDLRIGAVPGPRDILVEIPFASILDGGVSYYNSLAGTTTSFYPIIPSEVASLVIHVVACRADYNADSVVDFFDYLDFLIGFMAGDANADFNADDSIDFFDYLDFLDQFSTGC